MIDNTIDTTIINSVLMSDGIGRHGVMFMSALHDKLSMNMLQLSPKNYKDVPPEVLKILIKPFNGFGKVAFWTNILGIGNEYAQIYKSMSSPLKISYSMFESDALPEMWVSTLNSYFDLVVVPDEFLVSVYKNSGVKIPIFVIPLGIMMEDLLNVPLKISPGTPFTFGMSAGFWKRKNHIKLMQAFSKEFGNNFKFKLKIHGRFGPYKSEVEKYYQQINCKNIELITTPLSIKDYNDFINEIDCYVFPSSGEGFSVTPREALALGRPCIVTNNTAHKTICNGGHVIPLPANKKLPAVYEVFANKQIGFFYDCEINDLIKSMKDVVNNYDKHLKQAHSGRAWVKQYLWSELKPTYLNLLKPTNISLDTVNNVSATEFKTNNKNLYSKMKGIFNV